MKCLCCHAAQRLDKQLMCLDCWGLVPTEVKRSCYGGTHASRIQGCRRALKIAKETLASMQPALQHADTGERIVPLE